MRVFCELFLTMQVSFPIYLKASRTCVLKVDRNRVRLAIEAEHSSVPCPLGGHGADVDDVLLLGVFVAVHEEALVF